MTVMIIYTLYIHFLNILIEILPNKSKCNFMKFVDILHNGSSVNCKYTTKLQIRIFWMSGQVLQIILHHFILRSCGKPSKSQLNTYNVHSHAWYMYTYFSFNCIDSICCINIKYTWYGAIKLSYQLHSDS